jgi:2-keto-3-deoxy-L-rhamnonate aldolase RhmA
VTVVRVPDAHSHLLTHALDAGAAGIIFPHIDTPEEAAFAVSKCKYACSGGERSLSPCALIAGATDMAPNGSSHERVADENIAVICQIESKLALDNAEAIAAIAGVNCLMLGPSDLRLSLGLPSKRFEELDHPLFLRAVDQLVSVSEKYQKPLMTVAFKVSAKSDSWIKKFTMLMTSADIISVANGHRQDLTTMKQLLKTLEKDSSREELCNSAHRGSENHESAANAHKHISVNGNHKDMKEPLVSQVQVLTEML